MATNDILEREKQLEIDKLQKKKNQVLLSYGINLENLF